MCRCNVIAAVMAGAALVMFAGAQDGAAGDDQGNWTTEFHVKPNEWSSTGNNPYFPLRPGSYVTIERAGEQVIMTVLNETRVVNGVETRIVEERESKGKDLVEVSRNFYAVSKRTDGVFYFGEEVDIYKDGKIVKHEGAWLDGDNGPHFGLMMPGRPLVGARYYQEQAPGTAMDRAEIVGVDETVNTQIGELKHCVKIAESSPLEPGDVQYKYYAPGIGLVNDEGLTVVMHGTAEKP